jgi:hypothetical protein
MLPQPELRKRFWGQHMWARGYFCATVGAVDEPTIKACIENRKWDEDDQGFKITAPTEPLSWLAAGTPSDGFSSTPRLSVGQKLPQWKRLHAGIFADGNEIAYRLEATGGPSPSSQCVLPDKSSSITFDPPGRIGNRV